MCRSASARKRARLATAGVGLDDRTRCMPRRCERPKLFDDRRDGGADVDRLTRRRIGFPERGKPKHILDQMREARRLPLDVRKRPGALLVGRRSAKAERVDVQANLRDRRSQLVRHARHEIPAQSRELAFATKLHDRDDRQRGGESEEPEQKGESRAGKSTDDQCVPASSRDESPHPRRAGRLARAGSLTLASRSDAVPGAESNRALPAASRTRTTSTSRFRRPAVKVAGEQPVPVEHSASNCT